MIETIILTTIILMAISFIPATEENFNDWQGNFITVLTANAAAWGILLPDLNAIKAFQTDWIPKYAAGKPEANPRSSDRIAKNTSRKAYSSAIRKFVKKFLNENAGVSNDQRGELGLTIYDTTRTRVPVPTVQPAGRIDKILPREQVLRINDPTNPTSNARPKGVRATRVFAFVGDAAPSNNSQYRLLGTATRHLFRAHFETGDVGKKVFYVLQYENTRGETGPLSDPISGNIA